MSTTEPTEEMVEAGARAAWEAIPEHGSWDSVSTLEWADVRTQIRAALRAALAVAPASSDDDREALNRAWNEGWEACEGEHLRGSLTVEQRGNPYAAARRSPVSPPEDVTACETCGSPATYRLGSPTPAWCAAHGPRPSSSIDDATAAAIDRAIQEVPCLTSAGPGGSYILNPGDIRRAVLAALRAPVPVETVTTERPEVVVLCGSTRFKDAFWSEGSRLAREGLVVLGVADLDPRPEARDVNAPIDVETKERLDAAHMHMIRMSDRVHVIDVGGYIGESTQREIAYARSQGKRVTYLFRPDREEKP